MHPRSSLLLALALTTLAACSSQVGGTGGSGGTGGTGGSGGSGGSGGTGGTGGMALECPGTPPASGEACPTAEGQACSYNQGDACYSILIDAACTGGTWVVTTTTHDDCCPGVAPTAGEPCTPSPLAGGLQHPCVYGTDCSAVHAVCKDGAWQVDGTSCPP